VNLTERAYELARLRCLRPQTARVPSPDQRAGLDRQVARLTAWAAQSGSPVVRVEAEAGSEMNRRARRPGGCSPTRARSRRRPSAGTGSGG
jgi:hypothetical protein